jgi:hypothetical protein
LLLVLAIVVAVLWLPTGWGIALVGTAAVFELAETGFWFWRARCEEGADPGDEIVVERLDPELLLVVRKAT